MRHSLLALSLLALAAVPGRAATLDIAFPSQVLLGDTFDINVSVHDIFAANPTDTLIGFGFNFAYDGAILQLVSGAADGANWFDGPDDLISNPAQINGLNFVGFTNPTAEPLALATLSFKALAYGPAQFSISSNVDEFTGLVFDTGFVEISGAGTVDVVPEPGAFWLAGAALAGLLPLRRRLLAARR